MVKIKSVYATPLETDGRRILVDRFWPEGVKTRAAKVDEWFKELGPSYDLQRFNFDITNWDYYKSLYQKEIHEDSVKKNLFDSLAEKAGKETLTLIYGNRDPLHNHAAILKEMLEK